MKTHSFEKIEKNLRHFRNLKPETSWKSDTRAFLVGQGSAVSRPTFNLRFAATASLLLIFLLGSTSIWAAASLPGEPLYPLKRTVEKLQLAFTKGDEKLSLQENLAEKRIVELAEIVSKNENKSSAALVEVENSVVEIKKQVTTEQRKIASLVETGKDPEPVKANLTELVPTIEQKQEQLAQIETSLSVENQVRLKTIISNLETIKTEIAGTLDQPDTKGIETEPTDSPEDLTPTNQP